MDARENALEEGEGNQHLVKAGWGS